MEVYVTESKRLNGVPWLLMTVKIFVDTAGNTADIDAREMEVKFRCDFAEVLRISFLRDRLMKDLHSERVLSYEDWYRDVAGKCALSECESDAHFAKRVFDLTMALAITRIPRNFHVFFCKKPHQKFEGIEAVDTILNKNSMLCRASGKSDFYYEFRVRLFVIGDELVSSKKLKRLEEMDIVPDSQPL